jgi:hypothetical protein
MFSSWPVIAILLKVVLKFIAQGRAASKIVAACAVIIEGS